MKAQKAVVDNIVGNAFFGALHDKPQVRTGQQIAHLATLLGEIAHYVDSDTGQLRWLAAADKTGKLVAASGAFSNVSYSINQPQLLKEAIVEMQLLLFVIADAMEIDIIKDAKRLAKTLAS